MIYNYGFNGNYNSRTATAAAMGFTKFVHFGLNPPQSPSTSVRNLTFIKTVGTAGNGSFMMGRLNGYPNLVFIKTVNTGNGKVELHYVSSTDNFASWAGGTITWFSLVDVGNGTFTLHDMDGVNGDDRVFIKTQNTGGSVEVHWFNAADAANGSVFIAQTPGLYSSRK